MSEAPKKSCYVGSPAYHKLELACQVLADAFDPTHGFGGIYLVGSSLERPDWRDVDVRYILEDKAFFQLFPTAHEMSWDHDPRWLLMTAWISDWLKAQSGLPMVDFQFQPQSHANERHSKTRSALGLRIMRRNDLEEGLKPYVEAMEKETIPAIVQAISERQAAACEDRGPLNGGGQQ